MNKSRLIPVLAALLVAGLLPVACKKEEPKVPQMPSFINVGLTQPYAAENGSKFEISVVPQSDADSYLWELPPSLQLVEGQGTPTIVVKCVEEGEVVAGTIKVYAVNASGKSNQRGFWFSIDITPRIIAIKTDIEGSQAVEPLSTITMMAPELEDISSYEWNCPEGFTAKGDLNQPTVSFLVGDKPASGIDFLDSRQHFVHKNFPRHS